MRHGAAAEALHVSDTPDCHHLARLVRTPTYRAFAFSQPPLSFRLPSILAWGNGCKLRSSPRVRGRAASC